MIWWVILQVFRTLLELVQLGRETASEKDQEILLLRRQLAIYERKENKAVGAKKSIWVDLTAS